MSSISKTELHRAVNGAGLSKTARRALGHLIDSAPDGFWGTATGAALTAAETTLTNAGTASDYAIQALTNSSPFGFASQAEGETVVEVVLNNQARLNEIEARLQAAGIIA